MASCGDVESKISISGSGRVLGIRRSTVYDIAKRHMPENVDQQPSGRPRKTSAREERTLAEWLERYDLHTAPSFMEFYWGCMQ